MEQAAAPREAVLIRERREAAGLSRHEVARRAGRGASEPTVRRYETAAGIRRDPRVLARISAVLGITPDELDAAGRGDAAAELRHITATAVIAPDVAEIIGGGLHDGDSEWTGLLAEILAGLAAIDSARSLTSADRQDLRAEFLAGLRRDAQEWRRRLSAVQRIAGER